MDAKQLAAQLNKSQYPLRLSKEITEQAKAAGLVIVYGASDDLIEFDGAFRDEGSVYDGGIVRVDAEGLLPDIENMRDDDTISNDELNRFFYRNGRAKTIEAVWCSKEQADYGFVWTYKTEIQHATFNVLDGDEPYCRGIVFALADL